MNLDASELAARIDHTLLCAEATSADIRRLAQEAVGHGFATVCVNPVHVTLAKIALGHSGVGVCAVVGFPLGANVASIKAAEAQQVVRDGATEVDVVAPLSALLESDGDWLQEELSQVVTAAKKVNPDVCVKVILETALLARDVPVDGFEQRLAVATDAARQSGCDYLKTSTGYHPAGGATLEAVRLLAKHAGDLKVKASGGIGSFEAAVAMVEAGADRLGCSKSLAIVAGLGA